MKHELTGKQRTQSNRINRLCYCIYMLLVAYLLFLSDYEWAAITLGIALVFDPFDASTKWKDRSLYQKVWLLCHLALTFAGFSFLLFR